MSIYYLKIGCDNFLPHPFHFIIHLITLSFVRCEVLTAVVMKSFIFSDITLHSALKSTDVLEVHVTSIFRVEEQAKQETSIKEGGTVALSLYLSLYACHLLSGLFFDPEYGGDMFLQNVG
jgi:hypothetical protein